MGRIIDRFFLCIYSLATGILSSYVLYLSVIWLVDGQMPNLAVPAESWVRNTLISVAVILVLFSIRFFYIAVRRQQHSAPSIDQKTDIGDIKISLATVENLALRAASKVKGVHDLKARINVGQAGLNIVIRAVVDGDVSIPDITEEVQKTVKGHLEETTGIPVADVSVFVANIVHHQTFKSRVE